MSTPHPIERVSRDDLMSLAAERGSTPMQVGAVLMLQTPGGLDPVRVVNALARRVATVPRLRQRLVDVPWGCGRPLWVDDADFDVARHFTAVRCPAPGGEAGVLVVAGERLVERLPRDRPLWSATLVTDAASDEAGLVFVFHHVLADGIGGLSVLAAVVDGAVEPQESVFPRPRPTRSRVVVDAAEDRLRSVRRLPAALRRLRAAVPELRPSLGARAVGSSLNAPTGRRRRFATVRVDLDGVRKVAHAHQATLNDVLLCAIAAALHRLLASRGERAEVFVMSVPVSERRQASAHDLGNRSGVITLRVPGVGNSVRRIEALAEDTRLAKEAQRGASTAILGPLFRALAHVGLYQWFIDHQRLVHTFVTNLRGPEATLTFVGCPVTDIIPLSLTAGNVTVSFAALSYAGAMTVTLIADPDARPDLVELRDLLDEELRTLTGSTGR